MIIFSFKNLIDNLRENTKSSIEEINKQKMEKEEKLQIENKILREKIKKDAEKELPKIIDNCIKASKNGKYYYEHIIGRAFNGINDTRIPQKISYKITALDELLKLSGLKFSSNSYSPSRGPWSICTYYITISWENMDYS